MSHSLTLTAPPSSACSGRGHYFSAILAFCLIGASFTRAAETAYSEPIGFYTVKVAPGIAGGAPARTYLGAQLLTNIKFVGRVANVSGNTFSFQDHSWLTFLPDAERPSYAHVLTGDGTGFIANIESFRQSDILCSTDLTPWMGFYTQVLIRPHPHLTDLFGGTNRFGLGSGADAEHADNVVLWDSQTQQERVYYFHSTRNRWEEKDVNADASKTPVRFPSGLYIVRRSAGPLRIALSGELGSRSVLLSVRTGANVLSLPVNLSASLHNLISSDGGFSVIKGANASSADLLTLEEASTGRQRGPFYFSTAAPGPEAWREIGVNGIGAAIQPLDLLSTLILRRDGPPGYVLARGSLEPPAPGTFVPVPGNPEPGEVPLTAEVTRPWRIGSSDSFDVYLEKSTDLVAWEIIAWLPPDVTQYTFQLPLGESRTFYRFKAARN
jgi:hypothetical protein